MPLLDLPEPFGAVDGLLESGDLEGARARLEELESENPDLTELLQIKLALIEEKMPPQMAMTKLVALMRDEPNLPGAQVLYRDATQRSYQTRSSSLAYSHPPPPPKPSDDSGEE